MLMLQCLWCAHRNQAGSNFCNACGTPLYLKPCAHCDMVNQRAAVHCRNCGEAFSFDFVAAAEIEPDAPFAMEATGEAAASQASSRATVPLRASALAAGLLAATAISAYYAYRESPPSLSAPARVEQANASAAAVVLDASLATPVTLPVLAPLPDERSGLSRIVHDDRHARVAVRRHAAPPRGNRTGAVHATKSRKAAPAVGGDRSRSLVAAASPRPDHSICAEGVALSSACDVRTLAKGN